MYEIKNDQISVNNDSSNHNSFNRAISVASLIDELMPSYNKNIVKLKEIIKMWHLVVGQALANNSAPYDMKNGILYIAAGSAHSAQQLMLMKGNMQRIIKSRWDISIDNIDVSIGVRSSAEYKKSRQSQNIRRISRKKAFNVKVDAEDMRRIRDSIPDSIDDNTADAMAGFRLFFEKRFKL